MLDRLKMITNKTIVEVLDISGPLKMLWDLLLNSLEVLFKSDMVICISKAELSTCNLITLEKKK